MKTSGIRINDKENGIVSVELIDILNLILDGNSFLWTILWLEASGNLDEGRSIPLFESQIAQSENGFYLSWEELKLLATNFYQVIEVSIIGCKDIKLFNRRVNYDEIYEKCDFVIEMIDSAFWEIHSKDVHFINSPYAPRLAFGLSQSSGVE